MVAKERREMTEDHPFVRASTVCPLCEGSKGTCLVVCWPCYRTHGLRYGNPEAEARIDEREWMLGQLHFL